ncbi:hypothetical protein [Streptomyces sp. 840.1]|uniref:hypothetical protein n=1 Tax=Streptomyces sp. 840.1 TaxID=2485152 RepID=UPI0037DA1842
MAFCMSGNRVLAGMSVHTWDVVDAVRALVESGAGTDDSALRGPGVPLVSLVV